jgi:parallel beta-helix repeat protein
MLAHRFVPIVVLAVCASISAVVTSSAARGAVHIVRIADSTAYSSIAAALASASDGDTILVYPGVYPEPLTIDKPILLVSFVRHAAVIDARGVGDAVRIEASGVEITGFEIRNPSAGGMQPLDPDRFSMKGTGGPQLYAAIRCIDSGTGALIRDNSIQGATVGILVQGSSGCTITGNVVKETLDAIRLEGCTDVLVESNALRSNWARGIWLNACTSCPVTANRVVTSLDTGIWLYEGTSGSVVAGNVVEGCGAGIVVEATGNTLTANTVDGNESGIILAASSSDNVVSGNEVVRNRVIGVDLDGAGNSLEAANVIESNAIGVRVLGTDGVVTGNEIRGNSGDGVRVEFSATGVAIVSNTDISSNGGGGIHLVRSGGVRVEDNSLSSDGIVIEGSDVSHWDSHVLSGNDVGGVPVRYYVNETDLLVPADTAQLILVGCTETSLAGLSLGGVDVGLSIAFCSGVSLEGCEVSTCDEGVSVQDSTAVVLRASTVTRNRGTGYRAERSSDVRIEGGEISRNGKEGMKIDAVSGLSLQGVMVLGNGADGIKIEGASDGPTLADCTVSDNVGIGIHMDAESVGPTITGSLITANDDGVLLKGIVGGTVSDNWIEANRLYGLKLTWVDTVVVERNVIRDNTFYFGIRLCGASCQVSENSLVDNGSGILVCGNDNFVIDNIVSSHALDGMRVRYDVEGNTIEGNVLRGNRGYGIALEGSSNRIEGNEIRDNGSDGIHALERAETGSRPSWNQIRFNLFLGNRGLDLRLDARSEGNRIFGNSFGLVDDKLVVRKPSGARDDGTNRWDDGPLSGGNFWADYEGSDSNGDGFGDTPYVIPGQGVPGVLDGRVDRFPRMLPPWSR